MAVKKFIKTLCMQYELLGVPSVLDLACTNFWTRFNGLRQFGWKNTMGNHDTELGNLRNFGFAYHL